MKKILIALFTLALVLSGCSGSKVFKNSYSYVFATDLRNMGLYNDLPPIRPHPQCELR